MERSKEQSKCDTPKEQSENACDQAAEIDTEELRKRLAAAFQQYNDQVLQIHTSITAKLETLRQKEQYWEQMEKRMEENRNAVANKVVLDIGGKRFVTSKETLLRFKDSYFYALLSSDRWKPESDGSYFVDRNPKQFDVLLDYLRDGKLPKSWDDFNDDQIERLKGHFDYFGIPLPLEILIRWKSEWCGANLICAGRIVTKYRGGNSWNASVLASVENPVKVVYRITKATSPFHCMLGLAPRSGFKPNGSNYSTCGYYYYCFNGSLFSQAGDNARAFSCPLKDNDTLEVYLDRNARTISFKVGDGERKVAFINVACTESLYPAIEISSDGASVEIISVDVAN